MNLRPCLRLDGDWLLYLDATGPQFPGEDVNLPAMAPRLARVPAPIQALDDDLHEYTGPAWYRREFTVPDDWPASNRLVLHFGAAEYFTSVWVNDQLVGRHDDGYLPFELDITANAVRGSNTVTVYVSDPPELFRMLPHGKQSWYGPLSGLWQPVYLESRPDCHLTALRVTTEGVQARVAVEVSRPLRPDDRLTYEILGPDGESAARVETGELAATLTVAGAQRWSPAAPALYTARVTLNGAGGDNTVADALADIFGFRTFETRGGYFYLNGEPLYLVGALDQDYYPDLICTPPSQAWIEAEFGKAKAMGLNCLRIHIKVVDPRYYYAADRVGLLIWTEIPNWSELNALTMGRARRLMGGAIQRDWNHPSIVIRTIINESWGTELNDNPDHAVWLAEMYDWVKGLDPTRLVVDNSACAPGFHIRSDIDDFHFYTALPDGRAEWDKWIQDMAGRADWLYGPAHQPVRGEEDNHPPLLVSEFGNWGLPDLEPLRRHYGGEPWWFDTGHDWGSGEVYPRGAEQRFRALGLDQVYGSYTQFAQAAQWGEYEALKYSIESMRLYPAYAGYVITEFTDVHWECNGLLDMARNPKVFADNMADLNGQALPIARAEREAYWAGEELGLVVHVSHLGPRPLSGATLLWEVEEAGLSGQIAVPTVPSFRAPALPPLRLTAPLVSGPKRLRMALTVRDAGGSVLGRNHYDLAIFPRLPAPTMAIACEDEALAQALHLQGFHLTQDPYAVLVTPRFGADTKRFLQQGGRALFVAEQPDDLETKVQRLTLKARKDTAWDTSAPFTFAWFRPSVLGDCLPGDGRLDMTLGSLVPQTVMGTHGYREFGHEIWAGMFAGWLRSPAALIQKLPVGRGQVLATTLPLRGQVGIDPAATTLFHGLLDKLTGG